MVQKAVSRYLMQYLSLLLVIPVLFSMTTLRVNRENPEQQKPVSILFVGNSLTYVNNLPEKVRQIAKEKGMHINTVMLASPDYALVDHLAEGKLPQMVYEGQFTYLVVQQGPSSQSEGRDLLMNAVSELQKICEANNTKLALYMVWPAYQNYHHFNGVIKNYTDAATRVNAILCPVGAEWKKYIDRTGDISYYGSDQFHPSAKGTQVAAEIIYNSLFSK